jgi:hypothetical protein
METMLSQANCSSRFFCCCFRVFCNSGSYGDGTTTTTTTTLSLAT